MPMRTAAAAAIAASIIVLAGCAGGGGGGGGGGEVGCLEVGADLMSRIAEGANQIPIETVAAVAVATDEFPDPISDAYIVAMQFTDDDGNDNVGTWAVTGSLDNPDLTLAVDPMAQLYTDWPAQVGETTLDAGQPGVTEAKACLDAG